MSRRRIGFWYRLAAVLVKPPLLVFFKRDWRGTEHIPETGGFLTVVNHNSAVDPLSYAHFQYNSGRVPRFLAKESLFKSGFVGTAMRGTGQIPVFRESKDAIGAFRAAVEAVHKGECVAFYPEGTLTREPGMWPMKGKTGAARVALETRAPVIPVAQWGANLAVPPYPKRGEIKLFPRKTLIVQAGPPIDLSEFYGREPTAAVLRAVTDRIMDEITAQLADVRGEDPPPQRYDHRAVEQRPEQVPPQQQPQNGQQAESSQRADDAPQARPAQQDTAPPSGAGGENA
ncbi:1-acyl-sn-glycerol-3-phosphate acyltransferase [Streptomyces sp. Amel2xB2]|uniref:Acyltransferase n=1 Tax=Streptomyces nanshensis TaxID=518642 RepID=A0A1E7LAR8_9ACTN|nr:MULTISPECIES: lysophospholipid acyltransferase family protein [Streptomyces]OEV13254.1 acyltransferase [Streptomyces nanshensis]RAJ63437.1 1-acyl-sn-glycerol-3-phosphate acyltransferase [Streptomyces sp. Amel2xB2]